jgi:hypothetical protein
VSVSPLSLLGNGSVKVPLSLLGNGYIFYAVRVVSKESRRLVLLKTSCYIYIQLFHAIPPYIGQCLHFRGKVICVIYSINASYSSYANLKYTVKIN